MNKKIILLVGLLVLLVSLTACKSSIVNDVVNTDSSVDANQPVSGDQVATDITSDLLPEADGVEIGEMI
ncbi:MAG: hypothetical protein KJ583_03270 [Nanoarchaeota archaeon]|nr:hypothetical protein [Nanoarchaeota archaeon]MBU1269398.1 hypothetical protein [Nanoarchaeota archaeon]MBU1604315.1 hypothetical protein [Nanoarchaeota archaeon]MBU2442888.1 hypothetical protein [Nanoarchaeota archaeon]